MTDNTASEIKKVLESQIQVLKYNLELPIIDGSNCVVQSSSHFGIYTVCERDGKADVAISSIDPMQFTQKQAEALLEFPATRGKKEKITWKIVSYRQYCRYKLKELETLLLMLD